MPIDASIYSNVKPPETIDIGKLVGTADAAQNFQGRSAIGDIYQQATRPDGTIDPAILGRLGPKAGVFAPQIAAQAQERQQGQQAIDAKKMDNLRQWWQTLDSSIYPHLNDDDPSLHKKVMSSIYSLIGHPDSELNGGIFNPKLAVQTAQEFYGPDGKPLPPAEIRKKLAGFHSRVLDHLAQSEKVTGGYVQEGQIVLGPNGKPLPPGSPIEMTRNGAILYDATRPRNSAPGAPGQGVPPGAAPAGSGSAVPSLGGSIPVIASGVAPQVQTGLTQTAAAASDAATGLSRSALDAPNRKAIIANLENTIEKFEPGSKADWALEMKKFANRNVLPKSMQFDPEAIASQEEFIKQATVLAQQQFATLGGTGSNEQFGSAFKSNPNELMSKMGIKGVLQVLKGNEDATQKMHEMWQQEVAGGRNPSEFFRWRSDINKHFNPRVFQAEYMTSDERKKLLAGLSDTEKKKFASDIRWARDNGWIGGGSAQPSGQ